MSSSSEGVLSLRRIQAWVERQHPDRLPFLRGAADHRTLRRLEIKLGRQLPADLRDLYALHDGQPEGAPGLYLNQRWLPLDLVGIAWEDLCHRYASRSCVQASVGIVAQRPKIHATAWCADWLPLFSSPQGDHYCLDLRQTRPERYGSVIWYLHDRPERAIVAPSLSQLLLRIADGLEGNHWHLDAAFDGLSD